MSSISLLDHVRLLGTDENRSYLYIGTFHKPRSTAFEVLVDQFKQPQKVPPISLSNLNKKFSYHGNDVLKKMKFSPEIKFTLSILLKYKIKLKHKNIPNLKSKLLSLNLSNNNKDALNVYLLENLDEIGKNISDEDLLKLVPVTKEILNWLDDANDEIHEELGMFVKIIGLASRNSRQIYLQDLVLNKSKTAEALIILISSLRPELTNSVFRELSRQGKKSKPIIKKAEYILNSNNQELLNYAYLYLLSLKTKGIENHSFTKQIELEAAILSKLPKKERWKRINAVLSMDLPHANKALLGYISLSERYVDDFSDQIFLHYDNQKLVKKGREKFRSNLSFLLKYAEALSNPRLAGGLLCLSTMGRINKITEKDNKYEFESTGGPLLFVLTYIIRRTFKLIELWKLTRRKSDFNKVLSFYISHFPPEKLIIPNDEFISDNHIEIWIDLHPVLKKYHTQIIELLDTDCQVLQKTLLNCIKYKNYLCLEWLTRRINQKEMMTAIELFDLNELLWLYVIIQPKSKLYAIVNSLLMNAEPKNNILWDFNSQNKDDLEKVVIFFDLIGLVMPSKLFKIIISNIYKSNFTNFELLINYLEKITSKMENDSIFKEYFNIIQSSIEVNLSNNIENLGVFDFINQIVLKWEKIIKMEHSEQGYSVIDVLRIIFDSKLDEEKLQTWDLLSIETIVSTNKILNLEIHQVVEANIQYAINKPNWDQLARHFLAMGLQRPKRDAIKNSQLKKVPGLLLRDILGQISLVHETIKYCERNGFSKNLEEFIIQNLYKRGWNVDRRLEGSIVNILGNVYPRLRSYIAAYLVLEKGEVTDEMLALARDIENQQIRDKIVRSLSRFGTVNMWLILAESIYEDITEEAIENLKKSRMSKEERKSVIKRLIFSIKLKLRILGTNWMEQQNLSKIIIPEIIHNPYIDIWVIIIDYALLNFNQFSDDGKLDLKQLANKIIWKSRIEQRITRNATDLLILLASEKSLRGSIISNLSELVQSNIQTRSENAILALSKLKS